MSDAVLIGFGRIGYAVALNFFRSNLTLTVVDSDPRKLKYAFQVFGFNISNINVLNLSELDRFKRYNLAITCLPGSISYRVINKLVDLGVNVVDVSYFPEDPWNLHELAVKRNVKLVVDAGFAPGLSNIVLGYFHAKSGGLRCARIYVGGLSENPNLPLGLIASWSIEDLVDEYIRPARAIVNGRIVEVDPLSLTGEINIPSLGHFENFEYFVSDGIRTMLKTFRDVDELIEYTLRYRGHVKVMKLLRDLGLLSYGKIKVNDIEVDLVKFLARILERKLVRTGRDRVLMYIEAESRTGIEGKFVLDVGYDDKLGLTAMGKVTGFTQAEISKLILKGMVKDIGLIPPEYFGINISLHEKLMSALEKWNIKIIEI